MDNFSDPTFIFLGQIHIQLQRSQISYKNYLQGGKKHLYAKILRACNSQIRDLLLEKSFLLPDELYKDAITLISHYDIWLEKWDDLSLSREFALEDTFVFENNHTFPREAAENLEREWDRMKSRMNLHHQEK